MKILKFAVLGALVCAGSAVAANRAALEKALIENENKIVDAVVKGDVKTFTAMLAPGAGNIDVNGFSAAADFAKVMPQFKVSESKLSDLKVIWASDDTAIVLSKWTGKGTMMGQPIPSPTLCSTTWTRKGKKWLGVFHQETPAAPAPAGK